MIEELYDLLAEATPEERKEFFERIALRETDPELRAEMLSTMDECPCCGRWLGHNNPPRDEPSLAGSPGNEPRYRRQGRFDFDR